MMIMENKINIAELLKDCPKGMELYSPMFGEVYLYKIRPSLGIVVTTSKERDDFTEEFLYNGRYAINGECMLFPSKGKTTWEGFVPPCEFKDGDIIYIKSVSDTEMGATEMGAIYKKENAELIYDYCSISFTTKSFYYYNKYGLISKNNIDISRLATEEEKQKLFDAIKENGYKWNAETKTLEKLIEPKFNVGGKIKKKKSYISGIITDINDGTYKVEYKSGGVSYANIKFQEDWELVPDKFDINTLKPFDKVLVRDSDKDMWRASIFSNTWKDRYFCVGAWHKQCIPYDVNKELLGTTDDCDDFYKIW